MWPKNLCLYRISRSEFSLPAAEQFEVMLSDFKYSPCKSTDVSKMGWVVPAKGMDTLHHVVDSTSVVLRVCTEERKVPPAVLKEEREKAEEEFASREGRPPKKQEKAQIKEDVLMALLPRAFSVKKYTTIYIYNNEFIFIDVAAFTGAESCLALLRKTIGSLPVVPVTFARPIELALTEWVRSDEPPAGWEMDNFAILKSVLEGGGVVTLKDEELTTHPVMEYIEKDMFVTSLRVNYQDRLNFVVNDDARLKQIKFSDELRDTNEDIDREDALARFDADICLLFGEISLLYSDMCGVFGGLEE